VGRLDACLNWPVVAEFCPRLPKLDRIRHGTHSRVARRLLLSFP
jgi:hypothetical protein